MFSINSVHPLGMHSFCPLNYGGAGWSQWNCIRRPACAMAGWLRHGKATTNRAELGRQSVVRHGVDQIQRALLTRLGAHGETL